jgi:hypothetical protein
MLGRPGIPRLLGPALFSEMLVFIKESLNYRMAVKPEQPYLPLWEALTTVYIKVRRMF